MQALLSSVRYDAKQGSFARDGLTGLAKVVTQGATRLLIGLVVGHVAGPKTLGVVASAMALAAMLSLYGPTSLGAAGANFLARSRGSRQASEVRSEATEVRAVARLLGRLAICAMGTLALVSMPVWMILDGESLGSAFPVMLLVVGMSGYVFTRGVHFGLDQSNRAAIWDIITSAAAIFGVGVLAVIGVRGTFMLLPLGVATCVYTLLCWPWNAIGGKQPYTREIGAFVILASIGTICSAGLLQASMLIARSSLGQKEAGYFAAAVTLATPMSVVAGSLSLALYPRMAQAVGRGDMERVTHQTVLATRALGLVLVPVFAVISFVSVWVIRVIWGPAFGPAHQVVPYFVVAVMMNGLAVPTVNALTSQNVRGLILTTVASITGGVAAGLTWISFGHDSLTGVASGYTIGSSVTALGVVAVASRQSRHGWGLFWTAILAASALMLAVPNWLISIDLPQQYVALIGLAGGIAWIAFNHRTVKLLRGTGSKAKGV